MEMKVEPRWGQASEVKPRRDNQMLVNPIFGREYTKTNEGLPILF
jgi:hypothetical protein